MYFYFTHVAIIIAFGANYIPHSAGEQNSLIPKLPTVGISVLVRNKALTLPYFLSSLVDQSYPKDRLYVRFYCDHSSDNSLDILKDWIDKFGSSYHAVYLIANETSPARYEDETDPGQWTLKRFEHVIELREDALDFARKQWADYVFMLDADVFLTETGALRALVERRLQVVSPMLFYDGEYSNFWCAAAEDFYYEPCQDYQQIADRAEGWVDCFEVAMVHSAVLVWLGNEGTDALTYSPLKAERYLGPVEDTVVFVHSALAAGVPLHVCNTLEFGFGTVPARSLALEPHALLNAKMTAIARGSPLPLNDELRQYVRDPPRDRLNCSRIFMINLKRRVDRRHLMELSFRELGLDVEAVDAVDSRNLSSKVLREMGVKLMPGYEDPYHKRPMKLGEVACFLSHYNIWQKVVAQGHELSMVLEDDVRFAPFFRLRFNAMLREVKGHDYDLLYLGRKIMMEGVEAVVTAHTTRPLYSYWTLGYLVTLKGARKLLAARPLQNMLPVDEFLPIMFDQHPHEQWRDWFPVRELRALSAAPLLVRPTHYTGMPGYSSDTEDSPVAPRDVLDEL